MRQVRILYVDDEPDIVRVMSEVLQHYGYDVTAVGTVNDALARIASAQFDVLISDLNIGEPGDGFTVVSAMRRTQPACITLILTGYPEFDSALESIRNQVDDYLIKPAAIRNLIDLIEHKLQVPKPSTIAATKRIHQILRENTFEITQRFLKEMKSHHALGAVPITDEQRIEFTPRTLEEMAKMLESPASEQPPMEVIQSTKIRGLKRYQQGYTLPLLVVHVRLLEQAIYDVIQEQLRSLNLSYLMLDLKRLNASLCIQLEYAQRAFMDAEQRIARQAGQRLSS